MLWRVSGAICWLCHTAGDYNYLGYKEACIVNRLTLRSLFFLFSCIGCALRERVSGGGRWQRSSVTSFLMLLFNMFPLLDANHCNLFAQCCWDWLGAIQNVDSKSWLLKKQHFQRIMTFAVEVSKGLSLKQWLPNTVLGYYPILLNWAENNFVHTSTPVKWVRDWTLKCSSTTLQKTNNLPVCLLFFFFF